MPPSQRDDSTFDQGDMSRFMETVFRPHLDRFEEHQRNDDRRFDQLLEITNSIKSAFQTFVSVQEANLKYRKEQAEVQDKRDNSLWKKLEVAAAYLGVMAAIAIAVFK